MRAITVQPGQRDSIAVEDVPEPAPEAGSMLVETVAVGVCGTDVELAAGTFGWAPPGRDRLVLGHESLGRVLDPGGAAGFDTGDLVVGIVRRPDPVPCESCAAGEWDMCRNGRYTERGIKELDGFMSERWRIEPAFAIRVEPRLGVLGVLLEPASILAKAWEHALAIGNRSVWTPRRALITGTGPIGLLAALFGVGHGLDVHVLGRRESGLQPRLVRDLGATYHTGRAHDLGLEPDIVIECTGVPSVVLDSIEAASRSGVVCLTGLAGHDGELEAPMGTVADSMVLRNVAVVGSVNANRRHWAAAERALAAAHPGWLGELITRRESPERIHDALEKRREDVKVVIDFAAGGAH